MDTQNGAAQKAAAARAYGAAHAHPVEAIQQDWLRTQLETKHFLMSSVYGAHLPMAMRMEMETLAKVQRLPGLPSSRVGLECLMGRDETIDFEDFLGLDLKRDVLNPLGGVGVASLGVGGGGWSNIGDIDDYR